NDGVHFSEPWISDGTAAGTKLLADLVPEAPPEPFGFDDEVSGSAPVNFYSFMNRAVFVARTDTDCGTLGVFKTNGTSSGTSLLVQPAPPCRDFFAPTPGNFIGAGDSVYFRASDGEFGPAGEVHGRELWKTDFTPGGTFMVADLEPAADDYGYGYVSAHSSNPNFVIRWNDELFGAVTTDDAGREPWRYDPKTD